MVIMIGKWIPLERVLRFPEVTPEQVTAALQQCVDQVRNNLPAFEAKFPAANSEHNFYTPGPNTDWTPGFWTGEVWLAYENAKNDSDRFLFRKAGDCQVDSFLKRINIKHYVDHHDMGFLYIPSCVAAYKLTGSVSAREAALKAANQLITRYRPIGEYIQAWGTMDDPNNHRLIIDCLLNIPLLYWATEVTGDGKYLPQEDAEYYTSLAKRLVAALIRGYQVKNDCVSNGQLLHGTYAKKTPYNTCVNAGVDECVIWGDYYFMEALTRLKNPNWEMYW